MKLRVSRPCPPHAAISRASSCGMRGGVLISLSHFCPTAAALLFAPTPLAIVDADDRLRLQEPIEGLDGTDALPPLVRPGLLCDLEGYDAWERACIATFARSDLGWRASLDHIAAATERVRRWEPGRCSLRSQVEGAFADARPEPCADPHAHSRALETVRAFTGPVAAGELPRIDAFDLQSESLTENDESLDRAMRNYFLPLACSGTGFVPGSGVALDRGVAAHLRGSRAPPCDDTTERRRRHDPAGPARKLPRR